MNGTPANEPDPEPVDPADLRHPGDTPDARLDRRAQQILNRRKAGMN